MSILVVENTSMIYSSNQPKLDLDYKVLEIRSSFFAGRNFMKAIIVNIIGKFSSDLIQKNNMIIMLVTSRMYLCVLNMNVM
jgi:hypothetical protein